MEIIDHAANEPAKDKGGVKVTQMDELQYREAMDIMARNHCAARFCRVGPSPEAVGMIIDEFDLPHEKTIVKKASHWDIGQTWND